VPSATWTVRSAAVYGSGLGRPQRPLSVDAPGFCMRSLGPPYSVASPSARISCCKLMAVWRSAASRDTNVSVPVGLRGHWGSLHSGVRMQTRSSATASTRPTCASPTTRSAPGPGRPAIGRRAVGLARGTRAPCHAAAGDCFPAAAHAQATPAYGGLSRILLIGLGAVCRGQAYGTDDYPVAPVLT